MAEVLENLQIGEVDHIMGEEVLYLLISLQGVRKADNQLKQVTILDLVHQFQKNQLIHELMLLLRALLQLHLHLPIVKLGLITLLLLVETHQGNNKQEQDPQIHKAHIKRMGLILLLPVLEIIPQRKKKKKIILL
mmetsp:Transcript_20459/g.21239  ORF Transcript_20459/g.21239 Transcript_20459/m.21239 type:complete len:135 (+) Transcript_20459:124-528(+)